MPERQLALFTTYLAEPVHVQLPYILIYLANERIETLVTEVNAKYLLFKEVKVDDLELGAFLIPLD